MAILISFAGLPGTGKTTIAHALARATPAVYLRIDEIEAAILKLDPGRDLGPESYHIAAALAQSNLSLGKMVITDCVNPWDITRQIFADAAKMAGARMIGVETRCSDTAAHQLRIETREVDIPGLKKLEWREVMERDYTPWDAADVRIDTSQTSVSAAVAEILRQL